MKSIKSFWGQMHQKWFGPKIKDEKPKKTSTTTTPKSEPVTNSQPSSSFSSMSTR